jgi:8-oxo-dGTP diphosphatase
MNDRPNAASVALVRSGKVLLIKRAQAPYQHLWTFPGGRLEPNETIEQCAIREVQEELGLSIRFPRHVMTQHLGQNEAYRLAVFTTVDFAGVITPSDEITDHKWADPGMMLALRTTAGLNGVIQECFRNLGQTW